MAVNWGLAMRAPDIGAAIQDGYAQGREQAGQRAMAAYAQDPNDSNLNALAQFAPQFVMQQRQAQQEQQKAQQDSEAERLRRGGEIIGRVALWADTPEKWDAGVRYLSQMDPSFQQFQGQFSPEARMAALAFADQMKSYQEQNAPVNMAPGNRLVNPQTGALIAEAPFAPRPVTVKEGETVVEYAPGAGGGDIFGRMIQAESNGQQFAANGQPLTSPAGAIGIAQVMPGTAPEAAQLAGVPFDEQRYRTDPEYNAALGRAYFEKQLQDFGDPAQAVAAYNAGPGRVREAIERGGQNWLAFVPQETRDYVAKVMGGGSRVIAQGAPKQAKAPDAPSGYQWKPDGTLEPIAGGPADKDKQEAAYSQSAMDAFDRAIGSAQRLLEHNGFNAAVGVPSINPFDGNLAGYIVPGSPAADFRAELDAMKAQVFLPMVQSMKGMGALSNAEGEKLTASIGALDPRMSEGAFRASLKRIIDDLNTYKARAANGGAPQAAKPAGGSETGKGGFKFLGFE